MIRSNKGKSATGQETDVSKKKKKKGAGKKKDIVAAGLTGS